MQQRRWQLMTAALTLAGIGLSGTAHAQFTGPPPLPRPFKNFEELAPRIGHSISSVDNFTGLVGVAVIQGTGKDNAGNTIDFELDVRAMQGNYLDRNGNSQHGTFSFTWLDLYTGSGATRQQIHDIAFQSLNEPFAQPTDPNYGPFWTGHVPETSVKGNPYTSTMTLDFADAPQQDTFVIFGPTTIAAKATIQLEWTPGYQSLFPYVDPVPTYTIRNEAGRYQGTYSPAGARINFSFTSQKSATDTTPFTFTSNPEGQRVLFAQVGHESSGIFFR